MSFDWKNPDYLPIIKKRIDRLNKIRADSYLLEAVKIHYKHNPVDFINDWMMTYDPRQAMPAMPFLLWGSQIEYVKWLKLRYENKEDALVEKSRDAGATYLNMGFAIWLWRFWPGSKISFGSRKEKLVDEIGNPDAIFEKGRMILRELPKEFLPAGYSEKRDATFAKILNRENGSSITGEAGDQIGRGGRSGLYFKDESAFYERPERIEAALSQNSDVKIDVSTPNGNGNPFYKKRHSEKFPVFIFDWRDDPRKDDAWYQKQKDTLEPWILAQEVDRDYNASVEGICIPARYVQAAIDLQVSNHGSVFAGLDVADEGGDANSLIIRHGIRVVYVDSWKKGDTTQTARRAAMTCAEQRVDLLSYDSIGVGAGTKGEFNSLKEKARTIGLPFMQTIGVHAGSSDMKGMYSETKTDKDMFVNIRAKMWWKMRRRFERTFEFVNGIKAWESDMLISIPNDQELVSELSRPLREINEAGKIRLESKDKMRTRGIPSPNKADALMLCFEGKENLLPAADQVHPSEQRRKVEYITGKTAISPWMKPGGGNNYMNFAEGER